MPGRHVVDVATNGMTPDMVLTVSTHEWAGALASACLETDQIAGPAACAVVASGCARYFRRVRLRGEPCSILLSPERIRVALPEPAVAVDVPAVIAVRYDGKRRRVEVVAFGEGVARMEATPDLGTLGRIVMRADAWYPPSQTARLSAAQAATHDGEILVVWPLRDGFDPLAFDAVLHRCLGTALFTNHATVSWLVAHGLRKLGACAVTYDGPALSADQHDELVRSLWALPWLKAERLRLNGEPLVLQGTPRRLGGLPRDAKARLAVLGPALLLMLWLQRGWRHHPGHTWHMLLALVLFVVAVEVQSVRRWLRS